MPTEAESSVSLAGPDTPSGTIAFGPFRLTPTDRRLERDGRAVHIGGRALDILIALAAQPGHVVSKAQLNQAAWPGMIVEEANLRFHVGALRKVLDEDLVDDSFITTVAGRGYCLSAPIAPQPLAGGAIAMGPADEASDPVVGRDADDAQLSDLLGRAAAGEAQLAFVTGEAGIGKSALVTRLVQSASTAGAAAVVGRCLPSNAETDAHYPMIDILTQLSSVLVEFAAAVRKIAPTWAVQLPVLAAPTTARPGPELVGVTPHRMARELCALLEVVAAQRLLILVIEDLHWADQATLGLLRAIANRRLKAKLLVLITLRPLDGAASSREARSLRDTLAVYRLAAEIPLAPLSADQISQYLVRIAGGVPSPELVRHLHARSGGNPLFMRSMIEHWTHEGLVAVGPDGLAPSSAQPVWDLPAPPNLAGLIDGEIERLPRDLQRVIDAASVTEGVFSAAINHAATPFDEGAFEARCEDLIHATALVERVDALTLPDGRKVQGYAFRHMLLRDVAYARQSATRRAAGHAAVAARIEHIHQEDLKPVAGLLARHFLEAQDWAAAIRYLRLAARVALGRFSPREAAAALEQALAATRNDTQDRRAEIELEIKAELAPIYTASLDPRAPALYAELVSGAAAIGRLDIQCHALAGQALTAAWSDVPRAIELFRQAITLSNGLTEPAIRAYVRSQAHAWCSFIAGWDPVHAAGCEAAIEELQQLGDPVMLAAGLINWQGVLFASSRYLEAYELIASSITVLAAEGPGSGVDLGLPKWRQRAGGALCLLYTGRLGQAFEFFKAGTKALLADADLGRAATLQFYQALGHILIQDDAGAAALVQNATDLTANASVLTRNERQMELAIRGLAALGQGEPLAATRWLHLAGQEAAHPWTISSWMWSMVIEWGMTDACVASGHFSAAREHARRFHDLAYRSRERTWRALASESSARMALADGDLDAAKAHLRAAWQETKAGALPLAEWRLHAVDAALCAQAGDALGAARRRSDQAQALDELAGSLPAGHVGRRTLKSAHPLLRNSRA